jgi:hypothetical protein
MTPFHWTALLIILGAISASLIFLSLILFFGPPDSFDIELETEKLEKDHTRKTGTNTWQ